jgi:O-succinylbenzoic acid--CoA ligase
VRINQIFELTMFSLEPDCSMTLLDELKKLSDDDWLIGYNSSDFYCLVTHFIDQFSTKNTVAKILLIESDTLTFLASFLAAIITNSHLFLGNSQWKQQEWQQVFEVINPDIIIGKSVTLTEESIVLITEINLKMWIISPPKLT